MQTPTMAKTSCLTMSLLMLAACATTELNEWRSPDLPSVRFGHFMVAALFQQDENRRMFEDEFAWQFSNQGQMVTRSYNVTPALNANTADRLPTIARAVGADAVLAIRMIDSKPNTPAGSAKTDPAPSNLQEFLQQAVKDSYAQSRHTNAVVTMESLLFDTKSGKPVWTLTTEVKDPFGSKRGINVLASQAVVKIKKAQLAK